MARERVEVCVVGGGVVGLSAASACARRGHRTLLLDRFERHHTRGSSHGSERILRFAYADPLYVDLTLRSVPAWHDLAELAGEPVLVEVGCLDVGPDVELDRLAAALAAAGVPHERVSGPEAARRWPGVAAPGGALHQWTAGTIHARAAIDALSRSVEVAGGQVRQEAPVRSIEPSASGATVVMEDASVVEATVVVIAAGAWARRLVPSDVPLPAIRVTEELVSFHQVRPGVAPPPCFVARTEPFLYGLPTPDGRFKLGEHGTGREVDPDDRIPLADLEDRLGRVADHARHWLPGLEPQNESWHTCLYAATPTDDPVVERHRSVVVAAGFGGHGFKLAPAAGEIVADLVEGRPGPPQLTVAGAPDPATVHGWR